MPKIFLVTPMLLLPALVLAQSPCTLAAYRLPTIIDGKTASVSGKHQSR